MVNQPDFNWSPSDRESLYTLMAVDAGLEKGEEDGRRYFFHFLMFNVPGEHVTGGDLAFDWLTPFR